MDIRLENLEHVYHEGTPLEVRALHPVSLDLPGGSFLGIVGGTGSGKTTLVKHLNGLLEPTRGRVLIDGKDASACNSELPRRVGLVFQRPERQLFEPTVYRDISFVLRRFSRLSDTEIAKRVARACELIGIDIAGIGDRAPMSLPDGLRRKVAIAGVLVNEPEVLVLDEPAVGLDPPGVRGLLKFLERAKNAGGTGVVVVSHDMDAFLPLLDVLLVLKKGRMAALGRPCTAIAEMATDPELRGLLAVPRSVLVRVQASEEGVS
ncbi:MAG: ATP-binding cassette domain-containing protein [Thermodesulfobacteriota bacterium]